ncbi:uncharacterized protein LOC111306422 [Durio zibethinus]|uniref:Uncharacterized protein LOC111306422 n=1 Tax=Durio zibethinus TaxID=66656 RepID=A0A6P6A4Z5_DURZI|nr:uncharacterized protein LOC111306422 [Durio zibethinus]
MVKIGIPILFLFSMFFVALPIPLPLTPKQIAAPRLLCASQFALVNYVCAMVPLVPLPPATPHPALPSPPPPELGRRNGHRQGHRHGHRHRHGHHETHDQYYCCQWLKQVDTECVCDILVHLPPFLSRPNHQYTVVVDDTCNVTFSCGGRLRP